MSIFRKKPKGGPNLSQKIQNDHTWRLQRENSFKAGESVTAVAYDPVLQIYVCAFVGGELHLYGSAPVHFTFHAPGSKGQDVTHIQISPFARRLLCLVGGQMVVWSLDGILEDRILATTKVSDGTTFLGVSPVHSHALIPESDGTVHLYDLSRLCESPTRVFPSPELSEEVIMDIASSPHNVDLLAVATYGSIYLWQFSAHQSLRQFQLPDGGSLRPVCLAFHPNESIFAAGLIDGTISLWSIDDSIPLWVTTISELIGEIQEAGMVPKALEPVFKLSWSWVSGFSRLTILGGQPAGRRLATLEFAGTPLSDADQLVPKFSTTYDDYDTANIKDFVALSNAEHLLALNEDGSMTYIPSPISGQGVGVTPPEALESLYLPYELRRAIVTGQVMTCSLERLRQISSSFDEYKAKSVADGGVSRPRLLGDGPDPRLIKYDDPLLLISLHEDGLIYFDDISPRLWIESEPLSSPYPCPLPNLSVDLKAIMEEPLLWASLEDTSHFSVQEIAFIPEALELYALFKTGQLLVWKYSDESSIGDVSSLSDDRLVDLSTLTRKPHSFTPRFFFSCKEGPCVAFATCEVGFAALAYADNSIHLLDMRGPRIMFHQKLRESEGGGILKMYFTICRPEPKEPEKFYLLVHHTSGVVSMLVIRKADSSWIIDGKVEEIPSRKSLPHPVSCLLVDILTGEELKATPKAFSGLLSQKVDTKGVKLSFEGSFYRVTVSSTTIRCDTGLPGKNIKTVQLDGTLKAELVHDNASSALALFREAGIITVLSLPNLEVIASFQEKAFSSSSMITVRVLGVSGDFGAQTEDGCLEIWSMLSSPRATRPDITLSSNLSRPPGQEGSLISWLLGSRAMTGEEFDTLMAGSNRPPAPSTILKPPETSESKGLKDAVAATEERGHLADTLADKTDELGLAAEGMAAQARQLAAKTTSKKRRFGF